MFKRNQITAWSFTRYSDYRQCPLKAKLKHIDKIAEPGSPAMERGGVIHDEAAAYIKGAIARMPKSLVNFKNLFLTLRTVFRKAPAYMYVEDTWAFRRDWSKTVWNDWDGCWLRVKLDCAKLSDYGHKMTIYDWKTGKFRVEESELTYTEQLELYALAGFKLFPDVDEITASLVYLDAVHDFNLKFTSGQLDKLRAKWEQRVRPMMNDKRFAPRPNNKCVWCHYRKNNKQNGGGQCKY